MAAGAMVDANSNGNGNKKTESEDALKIIFCEIDKVIVVVWAFKCYIRLSCLIPYRQRPHSLLRGRKAVHPRDRQTAGS